MEPTNAVLSSDETNSFEENGLMKVKQYSNVDEKLPEGEQEHKEAFDYKMSNNDEHEGNYPRINKKISFREVVQIREIESYEEAKEITADDFSTSKSTFRGVSSGEAVESKEETVIHETDVADYEKLYDKETDQEFYQRVFSDWQMQDELNTLQLRGSNFSSLFFTPLIMSLKVTVFFVNGAISVFNFFAPNTEEEEDFEFEERNQKRLFSATSDFIPTLDENSADSLEKVEEMPSVTSTEDARTTTQFLGTFRRLKKFDDLPDEQRKQAAMVFCFLILIPLVGVAYFATFVFILFPPTTLPMLAYLLFIYYDDSPETGSRVAFLRYWKVWRHFAAYFPIRLVKTGSLDPSEKYVMSYHPHGIISLGVFGNFATDATGFSRLFPGIDLRPLTIGQNFYVPWLREVLLSLGVCSCSRKSCSENLKKGPGSAILLVVGGADESLYAKPGTYRLNVKKRKGFVRIALQNGAHLVPVLGFGENDAFTTKTFAKGSWLRKFQDIVKKHIGFATPIFWGTDLLTGKAGIFPHRTPIIAVVGKPVKCPPVPAHLIGKLRTTAEGRELVNKYHKEYIKALKGLYNSFKDKWAANRSESMKFVGRNPSSIPVVDIAKKRF